MTFENPAPKPAIPVMSPKALSHLLAACVFSTLFLSNLSAQQPPPDPKDPKQEQEIMVAPKDEKTVGFSTVNPGDVYKLDVTTFPIYRFITEGDDDILGENTDAALLHDDALWKRTINEEQHKQFKVTSGNIHEGHEAVFRLRFQQPQPSGGGGGGGKPAALDNAYVKAVNCFVKIHTPGTIAAPGILIPAPTQPGKPYTGILQPNTDDEIVTGNEDWSGTSKTGDGLTKDNDLVKVELSWNPFTLRPEMVKGKKLMLSLPQKTKAFLPTGQLLVDREVEIGAPIGQLSPLGGNARKQVIYLEADSGYTGGEIILYVDGLDKPGANGRAMMEKVEILPEATMVNKVGNLVPSTKAAIPERHFVTPKKSSYITDDYVILEANGVSSDTFASLLKWEGGEDFPGDILKRRVSRNDTLRSEVKISLQNGGLQLDKLNVWKVWATLTGLVQPVVVAPVNGQSGEYIADDVSVHYDCTATISPIALTPPAATITATTDIPDFRGNNTPNVLIGNDAKGDPLSGGATKKWDMSRRIFRTMTVVANPALNLNVKDVNIAFPTDPIVGNDDAGVNDESNNPYVGNGMLTSDDNANRLYVLQGGHVGATYSNLTHFQEFARLEIGGKWYNISSPEDWGFSFDLNKMITLESDWNWDVNGDGDFNDIINEQGILGDINGDGDQLDDVGRWLNNGSQHNNY